MEYREKLDVATIVNAPSEDVVRWLENNAPSSMPFSSKRRQEVADFLLFKRKDPAINLAIAKYGWHVPTLKKLYSTGGILRLAVLTNVFVGPSTFMRPSCVLDRNDVEELIGGFPNTLTPLRAYLENPHIPRDDVESIVNRADRFASIDDNTFLHVVHYLSSNPSIQAEYKRIYLDGYDEYSYNRLTFSIWGLFDNAPLTQIWAGVLTDFANTLPIPFMGDEIKFDWLERWRIEEPPSYDKEDDEEKREYDPASSPSFWLRNALAKRFYVNGLADGRKLVAPDHEDKAVRLAYYNVCEPREIFGSAVDENGFEYPPLEALEYDDWDLKDSDRAILDTCKKFFEKDGNEFLDELLRNQHFWQRKRERQLLSDLSWNLASDSNYTMDVPNLYRGLEARHLTENPDFFHDDDTVVLAPSANPVEMQLGAILEKVSRLETRVDELQFSELVESQRGLYDEVIAETRAMNREISERIADASSAHSLSFLQEKLETIETKLRRPIWPLLTAMVILALLLGMWISD
jgi:hypothetical protein